MARAAWKGGTMFRLIVGVLLAVLGLAACAGSSHSGASAPTVPVANLGATVNLKNIAFSPQSVTIRTGQAVAWTFHDGSVPHDVKGPDFASVIQSKGTYVHTFNQAGTFKYVCTIHSGMDGTVVVNS
jgi:plastocyanin